MENLGVSTSKKEGTEMKKVYHTKTQEDFNALMKELEEQEYMWKGEEKPTQYNGWKYHTEKTCIAINKNKILTYRNLGYFKQKGYEIEEYKALKKETVYHTPTQEGYSALMDELEEKGYTWASRGRKPTECYFWFTHEKETCVKLCKDKILTYGAYDYFKGMFYKITEYKAPKKEKKEMEEKVYHVKTQEDYSALMEELEEKGYFWEGGNKKPTKPLFIWINNKEETCVHLREDKTLTYCSYSDFENSGYTITEYKAPKKEKREMKEKVYHTATQEDFNALMKELEEKGYVWVCSRRKPTKGDTNWRSHKEKTCVCLEEPKALTYESYSYFKKNGHEITEYKALEGHNKSVEHAKVTSALQDIYLAKNADYGDSFTKSMEEFGLTASCIRMSDKIERLKQLSHNEQNVKDESILDTVMDLANYAIMTAMFLEKEKRSK